MKGYSGWGLYSDGYNPRQKDYWQSLKWVCLCWSTDILKYLPSSEYLVLSGTKFMSPIPRSIAKLSTLKQRKLHYAQVVRSSLFFSTPSFPPPWTFILWPMSPFTGLVHTHLQIHLSLSWSHVFIIFQLSRMWRTHPHGLLDNEWISFHPCYKWLHNFIPTQWRVIY